MTTATKNIVHIDTTRFGRLEVEEDLIITLPQGMIGFEDCHRFVVLNHDENSPFRWLQALDDGAVVFPVLEPGALSLRYAPTISDSDAQELELTPDTPKLVFVVATVPRGNPQGLTINLLGPVVINAETRVGKQVIVLDEEYHTKHSLLEELKKSSLE
jgi:flagellar assembly factor FliW